MRRPAGADIRANASKSTSPCTERHYGNSPRPGKSPQATAIKRLVESRAFALGRTWPRAGRVVFHFSSSSSGRCARDFLVPTVDARVVHAADLVAASVVRWWTCWPACPAAGRAVRGAPGRRAALRRRFLLDRVPLRGSTGPVSRRVHPCAERLGWQDGESARLVQTCPAPGPHQYFG